MRRSTISSGVERRALVQRQLRCGEGAKGLPYQEDPGALGGMAAAGILGMFVGATLPALGYQIFMGWVATNPEAEQVQAESDVQSVG